MNSVCICGHPEAKHHWIKNFSGTRLGPCKDCVCHSYKQDIAASYAETAAILEQEAEVFERLAQSKREQAASYLHMAVEWWRG